MWELFHKEGWAPKNWCLQIVVLEKTLDCKEIKPINLKGNKPWIFIGRTDTRAEALILWPPDAKSQYIRKDLMLGKIEGRRRSGRQRTGCLNNTTHSMDMNLSKLWEIVKDRGARRAEVYGVRKNQTQLKKNQILIFVSNFSLNKCLFP